MNREELKNIFKLVIVFVLIILAIKFFIYLLPLIILVCLIYFGYDFYKKTKAETVNKMNSQAKKSNRKRVSVQEAEVVREKNEE